MYLLFYDLVIFLTPAKLGNLNLFAHLHYRQSLGTATKKPRESKALCNRPSLQLILDDTANNIVCVQETQVGGVREEGWHHPWRSGLQETHADDQQANGSLRQGSA